MMIVIFLVLQFFSLLGLLSAWRFWRHPKNGRGNFFIHLIGVLIACFIALKCILSQRQDWDANLFPASFSYVLFTSILWTSLLPLLFSYLIYLSPKMRQRRALFFLTAFFFLMQIYRSHFLIYPTSVYRSQEVVQRDGICHQSSSFTCGPASVVSLLNIHQIKRTEGQMAQDCLTIPNGGTTIHQVCYGVNKALREEGRKANYQLISIKEMDNPHQVPYPALVAVKLEKINHMVCLKGVKDGNVILLDPHYGGTIWTWEAVKRSALGGIIAARKVE